MQLGLDKVNASQDKEKQRYREGFWALQWGRLGYYLEKWLGFSLSIVQTRPVSDRPETMEQIRQSGEGIEFKMLDAADMRRHAEDPETNFDRAFAEAAIRRGDFCAGAFKGSELIGYTWVAGGLAPHNEYLCVDYGRRYSYRFNTYVKPAYRGKRLSKALSDLLIDVSKDMGKEASIAFVDIFNIPSLKGLRGTGRTVVGFAGYWRLFGRYYPFRSPGAKRAGFRFVRLEDVDWQ